MKFLNHIGMFFRERQRLVLIAMLAVLHLTLLAGAETSIALMCWLVDVGLFLLWQPFIQAERRMDGLSLVLLTVLLCLGVWLFGEQLQPARLAGFVLIWAALVLFAVEGAWQRRRSVRVIDAVGSITQRRNWLGGSIPAQDSTLISASAPASAP